MQAELDELYVETFKGVSVTVERDGVEVTYDCEDMRCAGSLRHGPWDGQALPARQDVEIKAGGGSIKPKPRRQVSRRLSVSRDTVSMVNPGIGAWCLGALTTELPAVHYGLNGGVWAAPPDFGRAPPQDLLRVSLSMILTSCTATHTLNPGGVGGWVGGCTHRAQTPPEGPWSF